MTRRVLIATIGSLGDLNPFIEIGRALVAQGVQVRMAVPAAQVDEVRRVGLEAVAVLSNGAGLPPASVARGLPRAQLATVRQILIGTLPEYVRRLDAIASDVDAIVASPFVLAAAIVAEKRQVPLVPAVLQPFAVPLPDDPPTSPSLWMLSSARRGRLSPERRRAWNDAMLTGVHRFLAVWLGGAVDRVRLAHGLPARRRSPLFNLPARPALALYPRWFAAGMTPGLRMTGFVRGRPGRLDDELAGWLNAGPPPLVFTLGSLAGAAPGDFPGAALATARALGRRAVLLAPGAAACQPHVITRPHIDYGALFPHAAGVVHHGGIGTLAEALAAGKPQMIVPHLGDQFDNGARAARLGIGCSVGLRQFNAGQGADVLAGLLADGAAALCIAQLGAAVRAEDGAQQAAASILARLDLAHDRSMQPERPVAGQRPLVAARRPAAIG